MANWDNQNTKTVTEDMDVRYMEGFEDGYTATGPLPGFYIKKPLYLLTPYERGYWLGHEFKMRGL